MSPTPIATSTIAAHAFRLMELAPLRSFAETTPQAQEAAQQYPHSLDLCLEFDDWSFARRLARPAELVPEAEDVSDPDLRHAYQRPDDMLALRLVYPAGTAYRLDVDFLRTDRMGLIAIRYTARVTDEPKMPPAFRLAVSHQLAVDLAPRFVASRTKREELKNDLSMALTRAKIADRASASHGRLDGRGEQADWASEARA